MNTSIKGQQGYDKKINEKIQDFKEEVAAFSWIYKG